MTPGASPLPAPIRRALRILERQRGIARLARAAGPVDPVSNSKEGSMEETVRRAIAAIERAGAPWVLVGAEAVNLYGEPRATEDFDFVVSADRFLQAVKEIRREFADPEEHDIDAAVRYPGLGLDLIRSNSHALFRIALERARPEGPLRVPPPEVLVALKFLSAISPWRKIADRKQDAADLIRIYQTRGDAIDRAEMIRLAGLAYPGAEREFTGLIEKIDRGEDLSI